MYDLLLVFEPALADSYEEETDPVFSMSRAIGKQYAEDVKNQCRLFPYIRKDESDTFGVIRYTGFTYTRVEADNPLTHADSSKLEDVLRTLLPGRPSFSFGPYGGSAVLDTPSDEDYINFLKAALSFKWKSKEVPEPEQVKRFLINLDNETFERVVKPYLNAEKYKVEIKKVL